VKILSFKASNFMILRAVEITPGEGPVVTITGRNGQGKTSILDAIYFALTGEKPVEPIRVGEEKAAVKVSLGDGDGASPEITVTRIISRGLDDKLKATLKVEGDGVVYRKPQDVLDGLMGALSFDPLEFVRLAPKVQREKLLALLGLDFEEQDRRRKELFEDRAAINREVKHLEGQEAKYNTVEAVMERANLPAAPVDVQAIMSELAEVEKSLSVRSVLDAKISDGQRRVKYLRAQLAEAEEALKALKTSPAATSSVETMQNQRTILQNRVAAAAKTNTAVAQEQERMGLFDQRMAKQIESKNLTDLINQIDHDKEAAIAAAEMPIAGLSFDDNGLLFKGVPMSQISSSEQIKVTLSMAMAMNPKLKILRIKDGSLLDKDSMKVVEEMATDHGFQVWIESVAKDDPVGIVIEQGEVKA
jgi:DNA repair exonuclease SbcCD ATPase subunit